MTGDPTPGGNLLLPDTPKIEYLCSPTKKILCHIYHILL